MAAVSNVSFPPRRARAVLALVFFVVATAMAGAAETAPYRVTRETRELRLSESIELLADPGGTLTAQQVAEAAASGRMERVSRPSIPIPQLRPEVAFWLKMDIAADADAPPEWMLEVGRALIDRVRLFTLEEGKWVGSAEVGAAVPFSARIVDHQHFVFPVHIEPGTTRTLLLRLQYPGPANINVTLWQPAAMQANARATFGALSLYFGLAAGMLLYNLLLWLVVKDRGYLFYTGAVAFSAIGFAGQTGLGAQFAWGEWTWFASRSMHICYGLAIAFWALLTQDFLQTARRLVVADRLLWAVAAWGVVTVLAAALFPANVSGMLLVPLGLVSAVVITGVSVVAVIRQWPAAIFFCAAWAANYSAVVLLVVRFFGFLPENVFFANIVAVGSALDMILLSFALAARINEERRQAEQARAQVVIARQAGKAEVATNVLHNIGNTLNSANVSAELMRARVANSRVGGLRRAIELLDPHEADVGQYVRDDPKGRLVLVYLRELATRLEAEQSDLLEDLNRVAASVDHIKNVVATQQAHAGPSVYTERVLPAELVDEALRLAQDGEPDERIEIVKDVQLPPLRLDKTRVLQILVNVIRNAQQSMEGSVAHKPALKVTLHTQGGRLQIQVSDNGKGIAAAHLDRLFSHGFTTRPGGHGFGLHSSAVAAREMGGTLTAHSAGLGQGATFTLELPWVPA